LESKSISQNIKTIKAMTAFFQATTMSEEEFKALTLQQAAMVWAEHRPP